MLTVWRYGKSRTPPALISVPPASGNIELESNSDDAEQFWDANDELDEPSSDMLTDKQNYERAIVIVGELRQSMQALSSRIERLEQNHYAGNKLFYWNVGKRGVFFSWLTLLTLLGWPVLTLAIYHILMRPKKLHV